MSSYKFARRSFLRGCGGSAALMLPLLRSIEARAAGAAAPLRLLIIQHPLGTYPGLARWRPAAPATTTTFTLPAESAPFAPLQKYMVMVDGLNLVSVAGGTTTNSGQNTPEGGLVSLMTGVPTLGYVGQQDHCAGGPSIDQILLQKSPILGGTKLRQPDAFRFVAARRRHACRPRRNLGARPVVPLAGDRRARPGDRPAADFSRDVAPQRVHASVRRRIGDRQRRFRAAGPGAERGQLHAARPGTFEVTGPGQRKGQAGRVCVCHHAARSHASTTVRHPCPRRVHAAAQAAGVRQHQPRWGEPGPPLAVDFSGVDYYVDGQPDSHPHADLGMTQLRLIKAAFTCDLARVATFMWASGTSGVVFPATFQGATLPGGVTSSPHYAPSHSNDAGTEEWLSQIDQFYSTATSTVLQEFATTPDIDGNMLIDNTVIVYVTEVARAFDSDQRNVPVILFGGKNTRLKGGTFLKVQDGPLTSQTGGTGNRPFNDLWLALAPVFGVSLPSLGAASQYTGPLPGVFSGT